MNSLRRYGPVFAIPVAVVLVALFAASLSSRTSSTSVGSPGPTFRLPVEAGPGAGSDSHFEVVRGQVTAVDFWASWCPPCRESAPLLNRLAEEFPHVRFVGVNVEGLEKEALRQAHASFGYRFPSVADRTGEVAASFFVQSLPTLVVLDADRRIAYVESGVPDEDGLRRLLAGLALDGASD